MDKILKFGGTSVGTPDSIRQVVKIILKEKNISPKIAVVVSAFNKVTDQLVAMGHDAANGKRDYQETFAEVELRHIHAAKELLPKEKIPNALEFLNNTFQELKNVLEGVFLVKEISPKTLDLIMSFGERLSAYIISETIPGATYIDTRKLIKTDRNFGSGHVNFDETYANIKKEFHNYNSLPIITGFIASTKDNETITLGRGGSDFTAAIFGAALHVKRIEIWTDVDGVMTADPKKEKYAFPIAEMSYREALEMSHFGAKVIHPPTITPALVHNIPLVIKNSFHPEAAGTLITQYPSSKEATICGISSIDNVALLGFQGTGLVGVCGMAKRLFGALAEKGINVILISQGSSEHSICFAILPSLVKIAKEAVEKEFELEMKAKVVDEMTIDSNMSIIAVVGEKMRSSVGIAGKLFDAIGKNGINVAAIAQGSSELNISFVVKGEQNVKAVRAIHEAFFLSPSTTINIFIVGIGLVGSTLLQQIEAKREKFRKEHALDIRVVGAANSQKMIFNPEGLAHVEQLLEKQGEKMNINTFIEKMVAFDLLNAVFVDCTSSQAISDTYKGILNSFISIVTPNKKANSGAFKTYEELHEATAKKGVKFYYGANVGAGLPIISTIHELLLSGDEILKIEAILSGTMSFLFNSFIQGKRFSEIVRDAQSKGFTEPDPREDLSGMDVARKLLILARESKYKLEMDDITIEKFLPESCMEGKTNEEFYANLEQCDKKMEEIRLAAEKKGHVLRYIASFDGKKGKVSLQSIGKEHPFYYLSGSDNIVAFTTQFYNSNPLVIKGQGAGASVTAGKVFADIVHLGIQQDSSTK